MNYQQIVMALNEGKPFSFARYGDGEWCCMIGYKGANADGHKYYPELAAALRITVAKPKNYCYALQPYAKRHKEIRRYIKRASKVEKWADADVLHRQSWNRGIDELFEALRGRDTELVGPKWLIKMGFPQLKIREVNVWLQRQTIMEHIHRNHRPGKVWVLCASMLSEVIIYKLCDKLQNVTFIDAGSVFEPYVGKMIRAYHKAVVRRGNRDRAR